MNRFQKLLARPIPGWTLVALVLGGLAVVYSRGDWALCGNEVHSDVRSPDGRVHAVLFSRGCGATTGSRMQLSVLPTGETLPNEAGNVFTFSDQIPDSIAAQTGALATVVWLAADTLEVRYDPRVPLMRRSRVPERVVVRYVPIANGGA